MGKPGGVGIGVVPVWLVLRSILRELLRCRDKTRAAMMVLCGRGHPLKATVLRMPCFISTACFLPCGQVVVSRRSPGAPSAPEHAAPIIILPDRAFADAVTASVDCRWLLKAAHPCLDDEARPLKPGQVQHAQGPGQGDAAGLR